MSSAKPQFKTHEGNLIGLHYGTEKNNFASNQEGRPIYDKVLYVTVFTPGHNKSTFTGEVERVFHNGGVRKNADMQHRFGEYIEKWRKNQEAVDISGTPLEQWTAIDVALVATLKDLNIFTVEQMATCGDHVLEKIGMGARGLQKRAQAFIEAAKGEAPVARLLAENEQLSDRINELEKQIKALVTAKGSEPEEAIQPPKRGRPKAV